MVNLTQEQYEALIHLARKGTASIDDKRRLEQFLRSIETDNGISRSGLWIQWQEADQPLPPATQFPEQWPPSLRFYLELVSRPISRADVDQVLKQRARRPVTVLVTTDPGAQIGWTPLEDYFVQ